MTDALRSLEIDARQRTTPPVRTTRRRRRAAWIFLTAAGLVAAGIGISVGARSKPAPASAQAVAVPSLEPTRQAGELLMAGGYVRHPRVVNVVPRVSGVIATLRVSEGDEVREGDLIATLDRAELEQQVAESRAELRATEARLAELAAGTRREEIASARAQVDGLRVKSEQLEREKERTRTLAESGAVSTQAREAAESETLVAQRTLEAARQSLALLEAGPRRESVASARAAVEASRARLARALDLLGRTDIRAPLSGRVIRKFLEVGAVVSFGLPYNEGTTTLGPGSPIVAIGQLEGLEAVADVNQTDLGRLSLDQPVEVRADAFPAKTYHARVLRFAPRADRNKNTVEVTVRFDDPPPRELAHDMSVKLGFMAATQKGSHKNEAVPAASIISQGENRD